MPVKPITKANTHQIWKSIEARGKNKKRRRCAILDDPSGGAAVQGSTGRSRAWFPAVLLPGRRFRYFQSNGGSPDVDGDDVAIPLDGRARRAPDLDIDIAQPSGVAEAAAARGRLRPLGERDCSRDGHTVAKDGQPNALPGCDRAKPASTVRCENRRAIDVCNAITGAEAGDVGRATGGDDADLGWRRRC